jgi:hypothetical protein
VATVLVLAGTPIAFMLGASVSAGLLAEGKTDLILIPTKMLEGVDSFVAPRDSALHLRRRV